MKIIKLTILLIICLSMNVFLFSCSKRNIIYKLHDEVLFTAKESDLYDWIYVEDYRNVYPSLDSGEYGELVDCILNVEWNKVEDNDNIYMNATVKSIVRAGVYDYNYYEDETSDIIVSGIISSISSIFKYPEYVYKIIDNKPKLFDSFRFADVEKIKYKKEPIISDVDVNNFKINDASQLSLCESKIDKIIIPEQYTKNKTIPSFAFINNDIISEIEIVGDVGQINPNAFIYSAEKIIINGDIGNIEPKGFGFGSEIIINGKIENYTEYSFFYCDKVHYNGGVKQSIDKIDNPSLHLGLYLEYNSSYNLDKDITIKYAPYIDNKFTSKANFVILYKLDDNELENSKVVGNITLNDNRDMYLMNKEKYNTSYMVNNIFYGIKVDNDRLNSFVIPREEFFNSKGIIYIHLKSLSESTYENEVKIIQITLYLKYEIIDNIIYMKYNSVSSTTKYESIN